MKKTKHGYYLAGYRDQSIAKELKRKNPRKVKLVRNKGVTRVYVKSKNTGIKF